VLKLEGGDSRVLGKPKQTQKLRIKRGGKGNDRSEKKKKKKKRKKEKKNAEMN